MHTHLLCFVCKQLAKSLEVFIFNQTRKHYCFPHSAHEVIPPFGLPSLHLYCTGSMHCCWIHTNHRNLCTDALSEHSALQSPAARIKTKAQATCTEQVPPHAFLFPPNPAGKHCLQSAFLWIKPAFQHRVSTWFRQIPFPPAPLPFLSLIC